MKLLLVVPLAVSLSLSASAQAAKSVQQDKLAFTGDADIPAVTDAEHISVLNAQKALLIARQQFIDAQTSLEALSSAMYKSRNLTEKDAALCDGPSPSPCNTVKPGEMAFRRRRQPGESATPYVAAGVPKDAEK